MPNEDEVFARRRAMFREYDTGKYSVSELCRRYQMSRTWFYKLRTRRERQGDEGLRISSRGRPGIVHQHGQDIEALVLNHVRADPAAGPGRIAEEINRIVRDGPRIGHTTVYSVLKKHHLNTRSQRADWQRRGRT